MCWTLYDLYLASNTTGVIRTTRVGDGRVMCWTWWGRGMRAGFWWGKLHGQGLLGRPGGRWEDNIKVD